MRPTNTAPYEDLYYVPFSILEVFVQLEQDLSLNKRQQYKRLEDAVDRYIRIHNNRIGDGRSAEYILNPEEYQRKMREGYDKFLAMKSSRYSGKNKDSEKSYKKAKKKKKTKKKSRKKKSKK